MQTSRIIKEQGIGDILSSIYKEGNPVAFEADSEFGEEIKEFPLRDDLAKEIQRLLNSGASFFQFALYYPESQGYMEKQRINLDPRKCDGHTFRFSVKGWGLIYLQFKVKKLGLECRVAVNTEKRAMSWRETYPELKEPALWQWKVVERNARRIILAVTNIAQQVAPADAPKARAAEH